MSCTTIFRVRAPPSDWGSGIALTGSSPHLTSWSLNQTPPLLLTFTPPFFTVTLTLPADSYFEYKYVAVSATNTITSWEQLAHGGNRNFQTPAPHHTLLIDDDIFGNDAAAKRTLIPPPRVSMAEDAKPITKPPSIDAMCAKEYDELVLYMERTRATLNRIRAWVRHSQGLRPVAVEEEWSKDVKETDGEVWDEKVLIQECLDEGYALVELMRSKRSKEKGPSGWALVGALVVAMGVMGGTAVGWSPQVGREGWRKVVDVWKGVVREWEGWYRWAVYRGGLVRGMVCEQVVRVEWLEKLGWCVGNEAQQEAQGVSNRWWARVSRWGGMGR